MVKQYPATINEHTARCCLTHLAKPPLKSVLTSPEKTAHRFLLSNAMVLLLTPPMTPSSMLRARDQQQSGVASHLCCQMRTNSSDVITNNIVWKMQHLPHPAWLRWPAASDVEKEKWEMFELLVAVKLQECVRKGMFHQSAERRHNQYLSLKSNTGQADGLELSSIECAWYCGRAAVKARNRQERPQKEIKIMSTSYLGPVGNRFSLVGQPNLRY